jgi:hypothetical protein
MAPHTNVIQTTRHNTATKMVFSSCNFSVSTVSKASVKFIARASHTVESSHLIPTLRFVPIYIAFYNGQRATTGFALIPWEFFALQQQGALR